MSHTVVRGKPHASQLYLDKVLDAILIEQGVKPDPTQRDNVTLSQLMYHCLKERPHHVFMVNGATGEEMTNEQILKHAISLARAFTARSAKGKYAFVMMRNHQDTLKVYFALMFAGIIPFMMDPKGTPYEVTYFLKLIEPSFVFHDQEFQETFKEAFQSVKDQNPLVLVADKPGVLSEFTRGYSDDIPSFRVSAASMDDTVMLLPTSGSTGMPKATIITHRGLIAQVPGIWFYHTKFPTPTGKAMLLTTIQWMTFTTTVTSCTAYHVPLLMTPKNTTPEHIIQLLETYRPTWTFFSPAFATSLAAAAAADQLSSLETLILLGAPPPPELLAVLQEKLPKTTHLSDGYGTTETQGFIAIPDRGSPLKRNGWVFNFLYYKIVDDEGQQLGVNQSGELCVKGVSVIKGYHKHDTSNDGTFTPDGWYRTGDVFHVDENERISFIIRKKFSFKYMGYPVAPEEVEAIISSIPGVNESVVCATDNGPAAAVLLLPQADVTREQIHKAVNSTLSDHKRLHGGIAFVTSLPHTHSGKLKRFECGKLIAELIKSGQCF